jgi:hypothetical protein
MTLTKCPSKDKRGQLSADLFQIGIDGDRAAVIAKHERRLADQHDLSRALDELRGHAKTSGSG